MRLAYLVNQYPMVSQSFIRREIGALEAQGMDVTRFAVRRWDSEVVDPGDKAEEAKTRYILDGGVGRLAAALARSAARRPVRHAEASRLAMKVGWRSERGPLIHLAYLAEACVLADWLAEARIDHVHVHFGSNSTTVAMLAQALGGPSYSFTVHGPEEFDKPPAIGLPEKIKRAAFVVGVSSFGRSQLYRWCDYDEWDKVHIIHCGVDTKFLGHPFVPIPDAPRFVCIGRLNEQKGHMVLVNAARLLAAEGLDFKVVFVGDGELRPHIEAAIREHGLERHIEITGWATSDEVKQHLLDAQAMVLPSFAEGLPVVIMEALALSRPVISTYIAGIPELIEDGVNGWLVPSGDVEALANAMRRALATPHDTLEAMGKDGAARVQAQHDAAKEATELRRLFDRYVGRG